MVCSFTEKCDLHEKCSTPNIQYDGPKDRPDLLVVGAAPNEEDDFTGLAMAASESGEFLREAIRDAGFKVDRVAYTYVIKCRPWQEKESKWGKKFKVNREPTAAEIKCCKCHVMAEIEVYKPKLVLLLGSVALKALTGETGITTKRGRVLNVDGIDYVPTFSPEMAVKDETYKDPFLMDIKFAYKVLNEGLPDAEPVNYILCDSKSKLIKLLNYAADQDEVAVDLETSELSPFNKTSQIVCCSFSFKEFESWIIPLYSKYQLLFGNDLEFAKQVMKLIIESSIAKIGQNIKFDIQFLEVVEKIYFNNLVADIMLMHHCLSEQGGTSNLEYMTWKFIPSMGGYWDGLEEYKVKHKDCDPSRGGSYRNVPFDVMVPYAGGDTDACLRIYHIIKPMMENLQ